MTNKIELKTQEHNYLKHTIKCIHCEKMFISDDAERELCDRCQKIENKMYEELRIKNSVKYPSLFVVVN
jgi:phage FluMu protein Com